MAYQTCPIVGMTTLAKKALELLITICIRAMYNGKSHKAKYHTTFKSLIMGGVCRLGNNAGATLNVSFTAKKSHMSFAFCDKQVRLGELDTEASRQSPS